MEDVIAHFEIRLEAYREEIRPRNAALMSESDYYETVAAMNELEYVIKRLKAVRE